MKKCNLARLLALVQLVTIALFAMAVSGVADEIGARKISEACLDCHAEMKSGLTGTAHATPDEPGAGGVNCISCHIDWSDHVEDPTETNVSNPAMADVFEAFDICSSCHFGNSEIDFAHAGSHYRENINCSGCHRIHDKTEHPGQLKGGDANATCAECHSLEMTSFSLISSHPIKSGGVTCVDCHDYFSTIDNRTTSDMENQVCYRCHPEMEGPFMYEHEATRDYGLEDGGCLNCHEAHGSPFQYLLKEPTIQICQQCHLVPTHLAAHDGAFANRDCLECHIDIHGSNSNTNYFSDWFMGADCSQIGCHN